MNSRGALSTSSSKPLLTLRGQEIRIKWNTYFDHVLPRSRNLLRPCKRRIKSRPTEKGTFFQRSSSNFCKFWIFSLKLFLRPGLRMPKSVGIGVVHFVGETIQSTWGIFLANRAWSLIVIARNRITKLLIRDFFKIDSKLEQEDIRAFSSQICGKGWAPRIARIVWLLKWTVILFASVLAARFL